MMLMSAGMYFFNHAAIVEAFKTFGYPSYIIYPLGVAKILGLIAIWTKRSSTLKEWAYAGFFFDTLLALSTHLYINDGQFVPALLAMVFTLVSYQSEKKLGS